MIKHDFQYTNKKIFQFDVYRGVLLYLIFILHHQFSHANVPVLLPYFVLHGFFIMSAFLISRGLLIAKEDKVKTKLYYLGFYSKRIMRIFPVYFFYIFLIIGLGVLSKLLIHRDVIGVLTEVKKYGIMLFTFTFNFRELFAFLKGIDAPELMLFSHLWTVSIEEQFYLVIPTVILFLNRKQLAVLSIFMIIFIPILRVWYFNNVLIHEQNILQKGLIYYRTTFLQIDSFFYGILLATYNFKNRIKWYKIIHIVLWILLFVSIIYNGFDISEKYSRPFNYSIFYFDVGVLNSQYIYNDVLVNMTVFFSFLTCFFDPNFLKFFDKKIIMDFGGKYSYSAYVYQYLIIIPSVGIVYPLLQKILPFHIFFSQLLTIIFSIICIYLISMLSFWKMEIKFLNLLKNKK
ncbi:MAG: acyltransferase [Sphingobacteriales bacterium]|jgi:peptidoglycan/LPS O-acetylase OafA/YrhL|nr:MAG: acyltransferase [Sphingobacteriales bacterium]